MNSDILCFLTVFLTFELFLILSCCWWYVVHTMISSSVGTNEQNTIFLTVSSGDYSMFLVIIINLWYLLYFKMLKGGGFENSTLVT